MKKFNYLLLGLAGLTMASCSNDDIVAPGTSDGNFAITVKLPAEMGTRTWENQGEGYYGQGYQALDLWYAVYEVDAEGNRLSPVPVTTGEANFPTDALYTTVGFNLANSKYYSVAFFALSEDAKNVYSWDTTAGTISVDYNNMTSENNNVDAYDCFYNLHSTGRIGDSSTSLNQTVILNRPVAQINWGTGDYDEDAVTDPNAFGDTPITQLKTTFTTVAYNTFDMFTKDVTGDMVPVTLEGFAVPTQGKFPVFEPVKDSETGEPTLENVYQYVAMQYVLAPAASSVMNLNLNIQNQSATYNDDVAVNNAPVQANYRTNIFGNLLTDNLNITVVKDPIWGNPDYDVAEDAQALLTALSNGGYVVLGNDMVLPKYAIITKETILDLNGHTLSYSGAGPGYAPLMVNGGNLTITGEGTVTTNVSAPLVWVYGGGIVNIESGNFVNDYSHCVYLYYTAKAGGTANISGGSFKTTPANTWALNIYDTNREESHFNVTGGLFYDFNPQDNPAEGAGTNFVSAGYQSVETTINGETWFVVVPKGTSGETPQVVNSTSALAEAVAQGGDIYLVPGNYNMPVNFDQNTKIVGVSPAQTILTSPMAYNSSNNANLTFENLTLKTFYNAANHTSMGFNGAKTQTYNNVKFQGEFHVFTGDATFTDCDFVFDGQTQYNSTGQLWLSSAGTIEINNCDMTCSTIGAVLVNVGWPADDRNASNITINGLNVTASGVSEFPVVDINTTGFSGSGTVVLQNVKYSSSNFPAGLYTQTDGEGAETDVFQVTVK